MRKVDVSSACCRISALFTLQAKFSGVSFLLDGGV